MKLYILVGLGIIFILLLGFIIKIIHNRIIARSKRLKGMLYYFIRGDTRGAQKVDLSSFRKERIHLIIDPAAFCGSFSNYNEVVDIQIYSEQQKGGITYFITGGIGNIIHTQDVVTKTIKLKSEIYFSINSVDFYYFNYEACEDSNDGMDMLKKHQI